MCVCVHAHVCVRYGLIIMLMLHCTSAVLETRGVTMNLTCAQNNVLYVVHVHTSIPVNTGQFV